ncbi:MAG TPA: DUF1287 domain-containing protein [Oligoflexia bacterium]|nr:DUF1287 domain-containing protein [Oligoflexia bacterium]HMR23869.1 DUF1287 domain-containing protein [Oligoflexia bacterium]
MNSLLKLIVKTVFFLCVFVYAQNFKGDDLARYAFERTKKNIQYNSQYFSIDYPGGDIPKQYGVCTDVLIRSLRKLGIDLQKLVHEDMTANFSSYPSKKNWGLTKADKNIDHRRVPNLQTFFKREGKARPITQNSSDYLPGDIVTWNLASEKKSIPHIGIVSQFKSKDGVPLVVHNIGQGVKLENILFAYSITGHYRYFPRLN